MALSFLLSNISCKAVKYLKKPSAANNKKSYKKDEPDVAVLNLDLLSQDNFGRIFSDFYIFIIPLLDFFFRKGNHY